MLNTVTCFFSIEQKQFFFTKKALRFNSTRITIGITRICQHTDLWTENKARIFKASKLL